MRRPPAGRRAARPRPRLRAARSGRTIAGPSRRGARGLPRPVRTPPEAASIADLPWWEVFEDEVLQQLVLEALDANYDLQIAVRRVEQARRAGGRGAVALLSADRIPGQRGQAAGAQVPGCSDERTPTTCSSAPSRWPGRSTSGAGSAARTRPPQEALFATEEFRRGVMLSLVTRVAQAYLELLELDRELEIARADRAVLPGDPRPLHAPLPGRRRRPAPGRARRGGAGARPLAQIPDLERRIVIQENAISVLLGRNPGPIPRGTPLAERPAAAADAAGAALHAARAAARRAGGRAHDRERERAGGRRDRELLSAHRPHGPLRRPEHRAEGHREGQLQPLERGRKRGGSALPGLPAARAVPRADGGLGGDEGVRTSRR